jgi:hypothetical protein
MGYQGRGRQRNRQFFSGLVRGVSNPREGLKILFFLSQSRLVCSSLPHLRTSWKGALRSWSSALRSSENSDKSKCSERPHLQGA